MKLKKSTTHPPVRVDLIIKFLGLFAIGIGLALGFAILLSRGQGEAEKIQYLFGDGWTKINPIYLNLVLAGTLGGLLCSFLVEEDKTLEFPSWAKNDKGLKPGFLGDIFVGIAGAFIAYIVLPEPLKNENGIEVDITIFVAGLVGGYGGEYVMKAALKRLIQRIEEAELTKERLEEINQIEDLQNLANQQIYHQGLAPEELSKLQTQLESFSLDPEVKEQIFDAARDARRLGSRVKAYEDRINLVTPILQSLVDSEPENDRYRAQLACAYRDYVPPRFDEAIAQFNEAIKLRNKNPNETNKWHYELDQVVALIRKASQEGETNEESSPSSKKILADLLTIDRNNGTINRNQGLTRVFEEFDQARINPIKDWLEKNQDWLQQHPEGKTLVAQVGKASSISSTELTSLQPLSPASTNSLTPKPVSTTIPTRIKTDGVLTKVPIAKPGVVRTAIKPDRWDRALKKAFAISTGASQTTAKQDGLRTGGVSASQKMAQTDWPRIEKYIDRFYQAAVKYDVPPALLAAIASRESRVGNILKNGWGDLQNGEYQGYGIMQVDKKSHTPNLSEGPGGQAHINQATAIFVNCRQQVQQKHPSWSDEYLLKGATAAYNFGPDDVKTKSGMDRGTTGNDYSSDVIARAKFYAKKLRSLAECKAGQTEGVRVDEDRATVTPEVSQQTETQKITALKDTLLKKQPLQSSQLSDEQKLAVAAGQSYGVEAYKDVGGGHYWVKLASNGEEWYIYDSDKDGHWDTSWEGEENDTDTPVTPDSAVGEIHNTLGSIDWSNGSLRISKYFTVGEVTKNDHRRRPKPNSNEEKNILALAKELDKIRADWGSSVIVNSWFRPGRKLGYPYDVNAEQGGATNSQHIYGRAADIRPTKGNIYDFQKWLDRSWYGHLGRGAKRGFVHLDMRNGRGWKTGGNKGGRFPY